MAVATKDLDNNFSLCYGASPLKFLINIGYYYLAIIIEALLRLTVVNKSIDHSSENYFFILCLFFAYTYNKFKSSPRIRYIMNSVTPTYQQANRKKYHHNLSLSFRGFIWGSSSSVILCLAYIYSTFGVGPPVEKSLFLTTCPLKLRLPICYLGGKMRVVSKRLKTLLNESFNRFITYYNDQEVLNQIRQSTVSYYSLSFLYSRLDKMN